MKKCRMGGVIHGGELHTGVIQKWEELNNREEFHSGKEMAVHMEKELWAEEDFPQELLCVEVQKKTRDFWSKVYNLVVTDSFPIKLKDIIFWGFNVKICNRAVSPPKVDCQSAQ